MKKFLAILTIFCLLVATAAAESLDYSSMTDEELHQIVDLARNELSKRELNISPNMLILDAEGVQVYITGNMMYDGYRLKLEVIAINNTKAYLTISTEKVSVNGWTIDNAPGLYGTVAGKKQKGYFDFYITPDLLPNVASVEDIEFVLELMDADDGYETFYVSAPITIHQGI